MTFSQDSLERIIALVRRRYPTWDDTTQPDFVRDEIEYKRKAVTRAKDLLGADQLTSLVGQGNYGELTTRFRKVAGLTNLLYLAAPKTSDLSVLFDTRLDPATFYPALLDLLHGGGTPPERVGAFADYLTSRKLTNRWTFATYFRFLLFPESDLFIKPRATAEFLERAGLPDLPQRPSAENYAALLAHGADLLAAFHPMGARDFIDVQSIMWVAATVKMDASLSDTDGKRVWTIAAGEGARFWQEFRDKSIVTIGWPKLGDLSRFGSKEAVAAALKRAYEYGGEPTMDALCCYQFASEMDPGDTVIVKQGLHTIHAIGTVTSPYRFEPGRADHPHVRDVTWQHIGTFELGDDFAVAPKTLTDVTPYQDFIQYVLRRANELTAAAPLQPALRSYSSEEALEGLFIEPETFSSWIDALGRKKNVILEGAPGVGKTFVARRLADAFVGAQGSDRTLTIQLHQSYSYEEFIRGWRPGRDGGYTLHDGTFLSFCHRAAAAPQEPHVLVIDEINRGNVSRIFGELFMLLEADKRGPAHALPLAYDDGDGRRFSMPENVYLIGTMNTADRSLAMVDYALRRRFAFFKLKPAFGTERFRNWLRSREMDEELISHIEERMTALNQAISQDLSRLGPGFEIGHSFFCPSESLEEADIRWYKAVIQHEIAPLITEYWFDAPETAEKHRALLDG